MIKAAKADKIEKHVEVDSAEDLWTQINKDHGSTGNKALRDGDDDSSFNWEVIPYPCISLGDATHHGGLPLGCVTQFHGIENSGKTFLAMLMVRETQIKYPKAWVIWADAETSFDREWAANIGIDLNRVKIIENNDGAEIFSTLCGRFNSQGKKIPGILDHAIDGKLDVKLIVLDSIAALHTPAEEGRNFDEMEMGALPKFLKRAFSRTRPMLRRAKTAFIAINQAREVMGFGATPHSISYPGGKTWRHAIDFAIKLHPSKGEKGEINDDHGKVGHKILATVEKCRGGTNLYQAEFWFDFRKGVVKLGEETAVLGAAYGVVGRPNDTNWVYGGQTYKGKDNFYEFLDANQVARVDIIEQIKVAKANKIRRNAFLSAEGASEAASSDHFFAKD